MLQWNNHLFFDFLLPLIIFTTGYNIRRRKFFANIANISKFGLLGTVLTFLFLSGFTYALFAVGGITKCKLVNDGKVDVHCSEWSLDVYSVCYMCAILTGSDIIAFVTLVKFEEYPSLFSIVLGEGLYNDVVVIILYETMKGVAENTEAGHGLGAATPFKVILSFFEISIGSVLIGLFFGVVCTLMTKHLRFISQSAVFESTLLISCAMCGYMLSEMLHLSAICSLLVSSIVYSHYTWYNLSP
jgi:NhaP-type Na+/H+ or K+/H+ antiporter